MRIFARSTMWPSRRHRIPGHEYLDGETLVSRLKKGPLPLDQVLRHACEITDALDTAHKPGPRVMGNAREASLLEDLRFKIGHGAILNRVPHLDRVAANFTVLNEGLAPHGRIQHHRDLFPAIWARKEEFHPRFSVTNRSKRLRAAIGQPAMVTLARCRVVETPLHLRAFRQRSTYCHFGRRRLWCFPPKPRNQHAQDYRDC